MWKCSQRLVFTKGCIYFIYLFCVPGNQVWLWEQVCNYHHLNAPTRKSELTNATSRMETVNDFLNNLTEIWMSSMWIVRVILWMCVCVHVCMCVSLAVCVFTVVKIEATYSRYVINYKMTHHIVKSILWYIRARTNNGTCHGWLQTLYLASCLHFVFF